MARAPATPRSIDEYIEACAPRARVILRKLRSTIKRAAPPEAEELISYRMPAFRLNGILLYFAAFKNHVGVFPPVRGDAKLEAAVRDYAGPKGSLRFPLDQPIPYALVARIVKFRARQDLARLKRRPRKPKAP